MKVLDTDVCIELLRGNGQVITRRAAHTGDDVVTTWITASELFFGAARSQDPLGNAALVTEFLDTLARRATLVTGNRRPYDRIPGGVIEDWIRKGG